MLWFSMPANFELCNFDLCVGANLSVRSRPLLDLVSLSISHLEAIERYGCSHVCLKSIIVEDNWLYSVQIETNLPLEEYATSLVSLPDDQPMRIPIESEGDKKFSCLQLTGGVARGESLSVRRTTGIRRLLCIGLRQDPGHNRFYTNMRMSGNCITTVERSLSVLPSCLLKRIAESSSILCRENFAHIDENEQ